MSKSQKSESFFAKNVNHFCSHIYSMFTNGKAGTWLSSNDNLYRDSKYAKKQLFL